MHTTNAVNRQMTDRSASYRQFTGWLMIAAVLLLSACNPRFNWRQYQDPGSAYSILMPAKPANAERSVQLAGLDKLQLQMEMSGAEVSEHSFAVGHIRLAQAESGGLVMQAMRQGLLANLRSRPDQIHQLPDGSLQADGISPAGLPLRMQARFVISGTDVYQIVVMAPAKAFNEEQSNLFLSSFRAGAMHSATP